MAGHAHAPGAAHLATMSDDLLILDDAEAAGISRFRPHWDLPLPLAVDGPVELVDNEVKDRGGRACWGGAEPGPLAFDALNRSLLLRFPGAAEAIAARLAQGRQLVRVELVLPWRDDELWPPGQPVGSYGENTIQYPTRHGAVSGYKGAPFIPIEGAAPVGYRYRIDFDVDRIWRAVKPRWHAVAWALRRPWRADAQLGPTGNAAVNGAVFWTRFGAQDEAHDRFPDRFGPVELSSSAPEGRLDLTALIHDPAYGPTLAARLRNFADCGVLLAKEEAWDHRFYTGSYEFATATGSRAIRIGRPRLELIFSPGISALDAPLPPAPSLAELAARPSGAPTARMPDAAGLTALANARSGKPDWMPDWQWQRVCELMAISDPVLPEAPFWYRLVHPPAAPHEDAAAVFARWVDDVLGRPPRGWCGFEVGRELTQWHLYGDLLPAPAQEAFRLYWRCWLREDRDGAPAEHRCDPDWRDGSLVHPMVEDDHVGHGPGPDPAGGRYDRYVADSGDWRGNKSFFRSGFCYEMSTQNFNSTASCGALLGGAVVAATRAQADGRHGLERWLLREWTWQSGSGQEHLDHYYFAISLAGNKPLADFTTGVFDRLLGQSLLTRQLEELISAWHPGLRRPIAGASRTHFEFLLVSQDGLPCILHTLSRSSSAMHDLGRSDLPPTFEILGHDVSPLQVALQTLAAPWAPEWVAPMVDAKPLPFEVTCTGWRGVRRQAYLGRNFGLASNDQGGRIQCVAQWRHAESPAERMEDIATLDLHCGINETRWANDGPGWLTQVGSISAFQQGRRLLAITSPRCTPQGPMDRSAEGVRSFQTAVGIFDYHQPRTWELWVDDQRVEQLPIVCRQGSSITIRDGVVFVAIIPLTVDDCGRDAEVVISEGSPQRFHHYGAPRGAEVCAAVVIDSFWLRREESVEPGDAATWDHLAHAAGGFAIELADAAEHGGDFVAFRRRHAAAMLSLELDRTTWIASACWTLDGVTLEAASCIFAADPAHPERKTGASGLVRRLVEGRDPYAETRIERDTPYCQQGMGRLEKNGAQLEAEPGRKAFLLTEPVAGVYCGWNPLPDLSAWRLTAPGGLGVIADGRIGLARVILRPATGQVEIEHAFRPGAPLDRSEARTFVILGSEQQPLVSLNSEDLQPVRFLYEGAPAWAVSIAGRMSDANAIVAGVTEVLHRIAEGKS